MAIIAVSYYRIKIALGKTGLGEIVENERIVAKTIT